MSAVLRAKFADPDLRAKLLASGDADLVEGNTWHDQTWGDCCCGRRACSGLGANRLGRMLMELRDELRQSVLPEWEVALLDRQAVRLAAERSVLETAKAWRAARGKDTPTSVYLAAVRAHVAAVDALADLESVAVDVPVGQSGVQG
jgi:hypothetical protein